MILTDKCKEDFEKWYEQQFEERNLPYKQGFEISDLAIQYGVYIDFFDSVDMSVGVQKYSNSDNENDFIWFCVKGDTLKRDFAMTRQEAREQAILKANSIYNESK